MPIQSLTLIRQALMKSKSAAVRFSKLCLMSLIILFAVAPLVRAQVRQPQLTPAPDAAQSSTGANSTESADQSNTKVRSRTVGSYSESGKRGEVASPQEVQQDERASQQLFGIVEPLVVMRTAKTIFIDTKSLFFKKSELENELRKNKNFQMLGLLITRERGNADMVIEVGRKAFTSKFIYTVVDPRSEVVLLSGKVDSIGGTAADKIAGEFIRKLSAVRPFDPSVKATP